ncbi:metal ABC transporter solute-binding protein, Zn/Mn family [Fictibacillus terranigra]|uniref:Zinc ABC transporter substrate-binding protein n=1 Tax=Fictibacillus terranigra TaxID=3058424 RepID=A0ABT8E2F0_9BACL|nr:zinc ABC transporter substrate-binding protein [Fictibacillus sp. CENA-BCM004]MDN4072093.1 zinc ABC transporter substrate-binding protein [Fictibacillus sp. CENA-BCM004]
MKMKWLAMFTALSFILAACSGQNKTSSAEEAAHKNKKIQINTTIFPLEDFAAKIGGKYVNVQNVVPAGIEPHDYEPTIQTMSKLTDGDIFIYNGAGLEGFADKAIDTLNQDQTMVVKASEGISLAEAQEEHEGQKEHHEHGDVDPHVFIDPLHSIKMAENIKNALVKKDSPHKEYYEKNFEDLKSQIAALDQDFKTLMKGSHKKEILVSHAAYGYWEKRYGLKQIPISGLSPSNEPTQKQLQQIINLSKKHQIRYVLFEDNVKPRVADTVKSEVGAEALSFHNLESPSQKDISGKQDYISLMEKNINILKKVLQ